MGCAEVSFLGPSQPKAMKDEEIDGCVLVSWDLDRAESSEGVLNTVHLAEATQS